MYADGEYVNTKTPLGTLVICAMDLTEIWGISEQQHGSCNSLSAHGLCCILPGLSKVVRTVHSNRV